MTRFRMLDGSGSRDYANVIEDRDRHGNIRLYYRKRPHPKIRLREKPGTEAFETEYQSTKSKAQGVYRPDGTQGTLSWLTEKYYASPEFKQLDPRTQKVRRSIIDRICLEQFANEVPHGDKPYVGLSTKHVRRIRDVKADFPESANGRLKALRQLFKWAIAVEHCNQNPTREVPYFSNKSGGYHTCSYEEVVQFTARHPLGTMAHLAVTLLLYTGVRRSDVVRLGPQMESDGWLIFT